LPVVSTRRRPTKQTARSRPATSKSAKRATTKTPARRTTAKKTTRTRRTTSTTRRRNSTATTFGAAAGTVVMAFLLGAPWSVRIALIVLVVLGGIGYLLWSRRS
jgi:Flp pilus assembly protein TadB